MSSLYLTIERQRLYVLYKDDSGNETTRRVRDVSDWHEFLRSAANTAGVRVGQLPVYCSSTLDFPHEYTRSKKVIDLVRAIR